MIDLKSLSASNGVNPHKAQVGLSLIELMVALTISLFLTIGVIKIFSSSKVIFKTQEGISQIQENQRIAMDRIIRDVSSAGYMGCLQSTAGNIQTTLDNDQGLYNFANAIDGFEGMIDPDTLYVRRALESAAVPLIESMDSETDLTLVVDTAHPNYSSLDQWDIAVLSDCSNAVSFLITNDPADTGIIQHAMNIQVPINLLNQYRQNLTQDFGHVFGCPLCSVARIYKVGTTRYYIGESNSGNGTSLFVDSGRAEELIQGVSDFQVLYGIDSETNAGVPTPSSYVKANEVTDWSKVVSVKIELTLVSDSDGNLNKTISSTIRLRNHVPS
jgi:type IV pilus assembly protein PilW